MLLVGAAVAIYWVLVGIVKVVGAIAGALRREPSRSVAPTHPAAPLPVARRPAELDYAAVVQLEPLEARDLSTAGPGIDAVFVCRTGHRRGLRRVGEGTAERSARRQVTRPESEGEHEGGHALRTRDRGTATRLAFHADSGVAARRCADRRTRDRSVAPRAGAAVAVDTRRRLRRVQRRRSVRVHDLRWLRVGDVPPLRRCRQGVRHRLEWLAPADELPRVQQAGPRRMRKLFRGSRRVRPL
jgi:hypothetical protein